MKTNICKLTLLSVVFLILAGTTIGCQKEKEGEKKEITNLVGTKWKWIETWGAGPQSQTNPLTPKNTGREESPTTVGTGI